MTKSEMSGVQQLLVEREVLPHEMANNYTFNKIRDIIAGLGKYGIEDLSEAIESARSKEISSSLAAMIFIKHHLEGAHVVEVDRIDEGEDKQSFAVLVYPEGEVPIRLEYLPEQISAGSRLSYHPREKKYTHR